jgi:hypothetical protein
MPMSQRNILTGPVQVVLIGDTHVGSSMGLCPRGYFADDGNEIKLNRLQEASLDHWSEFWKRRKAAKLPTVTILMADLIDGNHHGTSQLWTTDEQQMIEAAVMLLNPVAAFSHTVLGLRGTPAHVGASGKFDNAVCREIGARRVDGKSSAYHLKPVISGVQFDVAHHGPGVGKKVHTFGNAGRSFARNIFMLALMRKTPLPQVIVRAHVHKKLWETLHDFGHEYHMLITPAWQWCTEYKYKIDTEDDIADVGGAPAPRRCWFRARNQQLERSIRRRIKPGSAYWRWRIGRVSFPPEVFAVLYFA